jgi:transcriptional regulator with XRE-family HTH domain
MNDFGNEARRLMAQRGWSLRELARRAHCDPSYLSKVLNGAKPVTPHLAAVLDGVFGSDGKLTARVPAPSSRPVPELARVALGMRRQDFLLIAGAAVAALDLLRDHSLAGLSGRLETAQAVGRVDAETVDGLEHLMLGYRQVYRSAGAALLLGPVCGTLNLLTDLAPGAGSHRDRLVSLIGQAGTLAGVILMLDMADFATARRYLAIGARAAQQADDNELAAISLSCRAFHATYGGDPMAGLAYAKGALEVAATGIHPRSHGWVAAVASEMHATLGPTEEAGCMSALETAWQQLAAPMPAQPWKGIGAFDNSKLRAYRGGDLVRLGRHAEAQAQLQAALDELDPALVKHRCTAHIDLAEAYVRDDKPGEGAHHASSALRIITGTRHLHSLRRVEAVYAAVKPSGTVEARHLGSSLLGFRAAS